LAAFCYITAMMIWKIGSVMIYYGQADLWFVTFICLLVATAGVLFQFDNISEAP
jgi:hypothetical protein